MPTAIWLNRSRASVIPAVEDATDAVLVHGTTVIVMGEGKVKPKGKAQFAGQTLRRRITNIWMEREGQLQLTTRQATIISKVSSTGIEPSAAPLGGSDR